MTTPTENNSKSFSRPAVVASALLPVAAVVGTILLFLSRGTGLSLQSPAPIENIAFERIILHPGEIEAHVLNTGPEPLTIAQVQVGWTNRASWEFEVEPSPTISRLERATVLIPYHWIPGEPYEVVLITANSLLFTHDIEIAAETPRMSAEMFGSFALLGIYVGVLPVFLGIGWLPFLRALPRRWYYFLLSLTSGLLVFLGVDALQEALENSADVPGPYQGVGIILIGVLLSIGMLYSVSGWMKRKQQNSGAGPTPESPLFLAYSIAFGIGVHNLGEGLAIGGAYALGEFAAGTMLVLGFTLHNLTEGVAVVAPLIAPQAPPESGAARPRWIHLLWLGSLAGLPTIIGTLLGAMAFSATWAVLFLAIGAGAVFQVVIEITRHQIRKQGAGSMFTAHNLAGFAAGLAIMYVTGLFVTI
ncbi:MAG: metal transporter [Acidobacteria bacterium]|nr:metal transporter [Acidobacteriota bacterium]